MELNEKELGIFLDWYSVYRNEFEVPADERELYEKIKEAFENAGK